MKCSVYYPDRPSIELKLEAADHRSAAEQFFAQHPRSDDCLITVVPSGMFGSITQFRTTDFMDEQTRQAALATVPVSAGEGAPQSPARAPSSYVTLGDIDIPFTRMVAFMVKWSFAAIPAIIIVFITVWLIIGIIVGLFGGLLLRPH